MAGPFSSRGPAVSDIADTSVQGGFAPVPGIADALKAVADVALPAIKDNHIKNLKEDISGQSKSIQEALLATANPAIAKSLFRTEALANPQTAAAFQEFNLIKEAVRQGKLPSQFALERLAVIQNDAIANAPEFEREIRAAMVQATGQDPEKSLFSQLLSTQAQGLTSEQKFQQKLSNDARRVGLTTEAFIEANSAVFQVQTLDAEFKRSGINGTLNLRKVAGAVNNRASLIMMDIMTASRMQFTSGAGLDEQFIANSKQQLGASVTAAIAEITATAGDAVNPTEIAAAIAPLEKLEGRISGMLDDGSWLKLVSNTNLLNKGLIEGDILQFTDLGAAWALGGPRNFLDVLKMLEKANTPAKRKLLSALSGKAESIILLGEAAAGTTKVPNPMGIVKQYGNLGKGTEDLDSTTKNERIIAANVALQTVGGREEAHTAAMQDLESVSASHAWLAFDNRKVVAATLQSKVLQAKLIPLQAQQTAGLATEYFNLSSLAGFNAANFTIVADSLVYTATQSAFLTKGEGLPIDREGVEFAARFNRANKISGMYSKVGVLPASRYSGIQDYFSVVTKSVQEVIDGDTAPVNQEPAVIKWGRDENGNPVRIN